MATATKSHRRRASRARRRRSKTASSNSTKARHRNAARCGCGRGGDRMGRGAVDSESERFVRAPVLTRRTNGSLLVLPIDRRALEPVELSGTGVVIWDLFASERSVRDAVGALSQTFDAPVAELTASVSAVVDGLVSIGALERRS